MNRYAKKYLIARMYGASDRRARQGIEQLNLGRRQTGRAIRKGRKAWQELLGGFKGYRSYDEQRRLYEKWRARHQGGIVAVPVTDPQRGHHERGLAIDTDSIRSIRQLYGYTYPPLVNSRSIISLPENGGA